MANETHRIYFKRHVCVGPTYDATELMLGNYHGSALTMQPLWTHIASANGAATLTTTDASVSDPCNVNMATINASIAAVVSAAAGVSTVVLALGGDCHEGEGRDRDFLHLPGAQSQHKGKQNLVVVLINGSPI